MHIRNLGLWASGRWIGREQGGRGGDQFGRYDNKLVKKPGRFEAEGGGGGDGQQGIGSKGFRRKVGKLRMFPSAAPPDPVCPVSL